MGDRLTLSPRAYTGVALVALGMLVLIVFSGAGVRLTAIEYGNRLLSALVGVSCVAAGLLVFRVRPFRRELVRPALVIALGVVAQGLLGAATVLLDLKWQVVIAHYLLSMVLLTAAAALVWRAMRWGGAGSHDRTVTLGTRALVAFGGAVIVAGTLATAAGPHAGGAGTGDVVERLDSFGAGTLKTLIYVHGHAAAVLGVSSVLLWLIAWQRRAGRQLMRALTAVCLLMAVQGAIGLVQYYNALPAEVVWVHASLPAVMWVVLVWSWTAAGRFEPAATREPARVSAAV